MGVGSKNVRERIAHKLLGEPPSRVAPLGGGEGVGCDLHERTALHQRPEAIGAPLERRVALRVGENGPEPARSQLEQQLLEEIGQRAIRSLHQQPHARLTV
jgi:hypothetical protein